MDQGHRQSKGRLSLARRQIIATLGGAVAGWAFVARAQKTSPVIGWLGDRPNPPPRLLAAFRRGLKEAGYVEGENVTIEYRGAAGNLEQLPALADDLIARNVSVIVASPFSPAVAAKKATSTIPVVFISGVDPVAAGLVASLAQPGGNLTGVNFFTAELVPKRIDLISDMLPQAKTLALMINPRNSNADTMIGYAIEAAHVKGLRFEAVKASTAGEFDAAFATILEAHADGLVVGADSFLYTHAEQIAALCLRYSVPASAESRQFAAAGGLMSYGTDYGSIYRQVGVYTGKILSGAKPADLPVQQPTKFELVINLNTAKALGLAVPQWLLARADEVIE